MSTIGAKKCSITDDHSEISCVDTILDNAKKTPMNVCKPYKKKHELTFTYIAAQNIDENNNCKFEKKYPHKKNILATFFIPFFLPIPSNVTF